MGVSPSVMKLRVYDWPDAELVAVDRLLAEGKDTAAVWRELRVSGRRSPWRNHFGEARGC
jgi:hypothetical protein